MSWIKEKERNREYFYLSRETYDKADNLYSSSKVDFNWFYVIRKIITSSLFRWQLKTAVLYAVRWREKVRGSDSPDVMFFECNNFSKIIKFKKVN